MAEVLGDNGSVSAEPADDRTTYAVFGERFFTHAVTEERIVGALSGLAGDRLEFGPIGAGPAKLVKVSAVGQVGVASATPEESEHVAFRLQIPVTLDLLIDLGVDQHTFHAAIYVGLTLTARPAEPLRVVIDIEPPTWRDVTLELKADGRRAEVLRRVAGVDREIRRFVAKYVAREIDKPRLREARDIDVAARIDRAFKR